VRRTTLWRRRQRVGGSPQHQVRRMRQHHPARATSTNHCTSHAQSSHTSTRRCGALTLEMAASTAGDTHHEMPLAQR
jgi:hypothetical protein